jgi:tripartite ATP-independent transporter DctM subunit
MVDITAASEVNTATDSSWLGWLEGQGPVLTRPVAFLGVLGMLVVSSVTMLDVVLRWLLGSGLIGRNEIVELIFAVTVAACIPYGIATRINIKVDLLKDWIVGRLAAWVDALGMLLTFVFFALLTWRLGIHAGDMLRDRRVTLILAWPIAPFLYGVTIMMSVAVLVQLINMLASLKRAIACVPAAPKESSFGAWAFVVIVYGVAAAVIVYGLVDFAGLSKLASAHAGWALAIACSFLWIMLMALAPLAAAMGLLGLVCTAFYIGMHPALSAFGSEVAGFLGNGQVAVLPLFLMMGSFAAVSGIADDIYALAHAGFCRVPGGLAISTIGGCAGFGAITGSTIATTAMVGRIALPEMQSRGYAPTLATGSIAAGGTLGNLVPPGSGPLVLFALLTEASIGQLFVASAIPSLLAVAAYIATVLLYVYFVPSSAPPATKPLPDEFRNALKRCGPAAALFGAVMGGLYFGIVTDTEAASMGAFGAFLIALLRGKLRRATFFHAMGDTTETTALVYPLIFAALIFALFCDVTGTTSIMTSFVRGLDWPPIAIVGLLLAIFIVLGTFMDSYTVMIVTVPVVSGLITGMGYSIVWWGVLNLFVVEIGGLSPPFGITLYLLKEMAKVSIGTVFLGVTPFCIAGIIVLAILVTFPEITLWLPSTMR